MFARNPSVPYFSSDIEKNVFDNIKFVLNETPY